MKNIFRNSSKKGQRGVALMFSLGILGLMVVLAMTFASISMTEQQTSENASSDFSAKIMARSAVNRALFVMNNERYVYTGTDTVPGILRTDEIVSGGNPETNIASGTTNYNKRDFDYLWMLGCDTLPGANASDLSDLSAFSAGLDTGCHTDFLRAVRYRVLDKYARTPGLEKCFKNQGITEFKYDDTGANLAITKDDFKAKSALDLDFQTTPFWIYLRSPVDYSIIGRFAYLAYRPHGLLDPVIYDDVTDSADTKQYWRRQLGLHPAEILKKSSCALDDAAAENDVYGRWSGLSTALSAVQDYRTGGDLFRQVTSSATVAGDANNTPGAAFPAVELACNNLVNKWFHVPRKKYPNVFWYATDGTTPKQYWRFNLNRSKAAWSDLTVFQMTDTENLALYTPGTLDAEANGTKCIPWLAYTKEADGSGHLEKLHQDNIRRSQVASNLLALYRPIPDTVDGFIKAGFWGRITNGSDTSYYATAAERTETSITSNKERILDSPDWTANMRTPYILDAAVKLKTTVTLTEEGGKRTFTDDGGSVEYIAGYALSVDATPELYVAVVDYFNTAETDMNNLKFRLPGYDASASKMQLSMADIPQSVKDEWKQQSGITFNEDSGGSENPELELDYRPDSEKEYYSAAETPKSYNCGTGKVYVYKITLAANWNVFNQSWTLPLSTAMTREKAESLRTISLTLPVGEKKADGTAKTDGIKLAFSVQNLKIGLYSPDGIPWDFAKLQETDTSFELHRNGGAAGDELRYEEKDTECTIPGASSEQDFTKIAFFRAKDVTCNLEPGHWLNYTETNPLEVTVLDGWYTDPSSFAWTSTGETGDDDTSSDFRLANPSAIGHRAELPERPDLTDYDYRTYPVPHPWEIGMLNRGEPFRTINLKKFSRRVDKNCKVKDDDGGIHRIYYGIGGMGCYEDAVSYNDYADGDANILDQIMVTAAPKNDGEKLEDIDHVGRLDINAVSFMHEPASSDCSGNYALRFQYPNRGNLFAARPYFKNIKLTGTPAGLDSTSPAADASFLDGGTQLPEGDIQTILENLAGYNDYVTGLYAGSGTWTDRVNDVREKMFHSRAEILQDPSSLPTGPKEMLTNLQGKLIASGTTDAAKEELFCKVVMLLEAGDVTAAQPDDSLIVFGIAQSIRDSARTGVPIDLIQDGSYSTTPLEIDAASPVTGGLNDKGGPYRNRSGKYVNFAEITSGSRPSIQIWSKLGYTNMLSVSGSKFTIDTSSGNATGVGSTGRGYYQIGFDTITGTSRILGWLTKGADGKWKIERISYAD